MDDKQMMIDGKECRYWFRPNPDDYRKCSLRGKNDNCDEITDCFIKELLGKLALKEQECERLKKKLKPKLKNAHCAYFDGQTGWCKAKEFIRCNPIGCKLYTIDELSTIVDLQQQLDQIKEENEKLKKQVCSLRPELKFIIDKTCCKYNIEAKYYHEKIVEIINNLDKYERNLADIKEIAEPFCNACQEFELEKMGRNCMYCNYGKILQKIKEVLNGTNP